MLLACVCLAIFISSALAVPVAAITAAGQFHSLTEIGGGSFANLYYVSNMTIQPPSIRWDCTKTADACTQNCGKSNANGPWCHIPSVPSGQTLNLDTWPWQVRWGTPVQPGSSDHATGVQSGFGFRGTTNYNVDTIYDTFWVGESVHFNNPIWSKGGAADSWTMVITISITPVGGTTSSASFSYDLNLDETNNDCQTNDGCPWTSSWWAANPGLDTRPDCPGKPSSNVSVPTLPGSGLKCCRYYTVSQACADRIWTLKQLDQSVKLTVAGHDYTLNIQGFSVPGNPSVQKSYFISQETLHTQAEIYGNLVDACPDACPGNVGYIVVGHSCVCACYNTTTCAAGQSVNSTCGCNCNSDALNCHGGTIKKNATGSCECDCAGTTCSGVQVQNPGDCSCACPVGYCRSGTVADPANPNCPCTCPPCANPKMVSDARCNCSCPASAEAACKASGGDLQPNCSCNVDCACFNTSCQINTGCNHTTGICDYTYPGSETPCDPTGSLCIAACDGQGTCVYRDVDCTVNITISPPDDVCFNRFCNATDGVCYKTFLENATCTTALTDPQCQTSICTGDHCGVVPTNENGPCTIPGVDQCNTAKCVSGSCTLVPLPGQPCTDGSGCTYLEGITDATGGHSDGCVLYNATFATCKSNRTICDGITRECNQVTCNDTVAGSFCLFTPLEYGTTCDDGLMCTQNDVCQQQLQSDPTTGKVGFVPNGVCRGSNVPCTSPNPCLVGRCLEGTGCTMRGDVLQGFVCNSTNKNCTIYRCSNGTCKEAEHVCPHGGSHKGAIAGAAAGGAAVLCLAVALALWARSRAAASGIFDPNTWDQKALAQAPNNPLYHARDREFTNPHYDQTM